MAWTTRHFSKREVNDAGRTLLADAASPEELEHAFQVVNNYRSSHGFPLNTFQMGLRRKANIVDTNSLVAQRIKRLSSITHKLQRFDTMELTQMQDLGGCRAIVHTTQQVREMVDLYQKSRMKHKLDHIDDYISNPRPSGYRGVHLIYRYFSDRNETYNGLKIEMQLRSQFQHAWATAVEIVGTFTDQALKSSQGQEEWLRFFTLMGTAVAIMEKTPHVPDAPTSTKELVAEIRKHEGDLDIKNRLTQYGAALKTTEERDVEDAHYFLLKLDPAADNVTVTGYSSREIEEAQREYLAVERGIEDIEGAEAVLVSVESFASLRRAYPNYFLDTKKFVELVDRALGL